MSSAGEVGVDLDADRAVMDITTLDSVIQRLGRVNRTGLVQAKIAIVFTEKEAEGRRSGTRREPKLKDLKRRERRLSPYFDGFPTFRHRLCEVSTGEISKSVSRRPLDLRGFMGKSSKHSRRCLRRFSFPLFICAAHRMRPTHPAASSSGAGRCRIWSGLEAMPPRKRSLSSGRAPTRLLAR